MASPEVLNFAELLQPISDAAPAGVELKQDSAGSQVFYQVSDARRAARDAERQRRQWEMTKDSESGQSPEPPPPPPNWNSVMSLAVDALARHSKDLWLAAWLIEALARLHGFAGLRDGFRLTRELCEGFWDGIHPRPDEDEGYAHTVAQLAGLNGQDADGALIAPIRSIPVTKGTDLRPLSVADYRRAREISERVTDPAAVERLIQQGAVTLEMFDREAAATPADWIQSVCDDIQQCEDEFSRLSSLLDERCGQTPEGGPASPPVSQIRNALAECRELLLRMAPAKTVEEPAEQPQSGPKATPDGFTPAQAVLPSGKIASREEGFRVLSQVAEFFRRTEPHSPVSYHVEQAVRWGRMSLQDLWVELIPEEARRDVFRRVGLALPESEL